MTKPVQNLTVVSRGKAAVRIARSGTSLFAAHRCADADGGGNGLGLQHVFAAHHRGRALGLRPEHAWET